LDDGLAVGVVACRGGGDVCLIGVDGPEELLFRSVLDLAESAGHEVMARPSGRPDKAGTDVATGDTFVEIFGYANDSRAWLTSVTRDSHEVY